MKRLEREIRELADFVHAHSADFGRAQGPAAAAHEIYRRLSAKYHPDRNPQHAEIMKDLNELYQAMRNRSRA